MRSSMKKKAGFLIINSLESWIKLIIGFATDSNKTPA